MQNQQTSRLISVIIPVYNVEGFLPLTLESVLHSTCTDYELILVDDGSTDGSGAICDRYAQENKNIQVIHKPNGGVSSARNSGLDVARGKYVCFIDGDDMIHPQMFAEQVRAIESGDYDFSMVMMRMVRSDECDALVGKRWTAQEVTSSFRDILQRDYMLNLYAQGEKSIQYQGPWGKLYKRDFIAEERYVKTGSEDTEWNNRMALKMKRAVQINLEMYYYVYRASSASHGGVTSRFLDIMNSYKLCLDSIPVEQTTYRSWCLDKLYRCMLSATIRARGTSLAEEAIGIANRIYAETVEEFKHSEIPLARKISLLFFFHVPCLYSLFLGSMDWIARLKTKYK